MPKMRSSVHGPLVATAVMFSSTVSDLKMLRSCGTQPMPAMARWSGRMRVTSTPPRRMVPARRRVRPTMVLMRVVLPVPFRPKRASAWPSGSLNEMSVRTTASP